MTDATKFIIEHNDSLLSQVSPKGESALTMACRLNGKDVINLAEFILRKAPFLRDKVLIFSTFL